MTTAVAEGTTATLVLNTETNITAAVTTAGNYVYGADLSTMVNGDVVELRIWTKMLSTSTEKLAYYAVYAHAQSDGNKYSVPVPVLHQIRCTIEQTEGTVRGYDYSLMTVT